MLQTHIALDHYNTLKVHCTAKYFLEIGSTYQLLQAIETPEWKQEKKRILGGGANTLFVSDFFDGLVVKIGIKGFKILAEDEQSLVLQVGAGEKWQDLVDYCVAHQLGGIENMTDIPGNVGTSAVSNIGAYGQEVSSVIEEVIGLNLQTKTLQKLSNADCAFAYRESVFKHDLEGEFIITHISFRLKKIDQNYSFATAYADVQAAFAEQEIAFEELSPSEKLQTLVTTISEIRASKLPNLEQTGTAGSFFKNPEISLPQREQLHQRFPQLKAHLTSQELMKLSAGQLIELCGWKGKTLNNVKMSEQHALILINKSKAGKDVLHYAEQVQAAVYEQFGIELEPEVRYCQ
ncbi:MAG: UDP-N-acetylmuramate dehydrogenase [bacterium]|nr:UDP-N-acetylmuramate dehydrogenase [bacterium]